MVENKARRVRRAILQKQDGLSDSYFAEMRKRNYGKYRYICLWGYREYIEESSRVRNVMTDIYYTLQPRGKLSDFYRRHLQGEYVSVESFLVSLNNFAFGSYRISTQFNAFKRMKKIEKAYLKYLESEHE